MDDSPWTELPGLYDQASLEELCHELEGARVDFESASVALKDGVEDAPRAGRVRVRTSHVRTAAKVLGLFYDLEDPADAQPYSGQCPACEEEVVESWTCASCELSFKANVSEHDPLVVFLRQHDGFVTEADLAEDEPSP